MTVINEGKYGEKCYKVYLKTGTAWLEEFEIYAYSETEAVEILAEYVVENELDGLWYDFFELANECDFEEDVDTYAANHGFIPCDKGVYLSLERIEEISNIKGCL